MLRISHFAAVAAVALYLLGAPPSVGHADALRRAGDGLRGKSAAEGEGSKRAGRGKGKGKGKGRRRTSDDDGVELDPATREAIATAMTLPWKLPHWVLSARYPRMAGFAAYPYARGERGLMREHHPAGGRAQWHAIRAGLDAGLHGAALGSGALEAQVDFVMPLALRGRLRVFGEAGSTGQAHGGDPPARWASLGELDALIRFAQSPGLVFHSGLGYAQWSDGQGALPGIAFHYGFTAYPLRPLALGSEVSAALIGQGHLVRWRSHVGLVVGRWEARLGYALIDVGGQSLGGPLLGVQVHL